MIGTTRRMILKAAAVSSGLILGGGSVASQEVAFSETITNPTTNSLPAPEKVIKAAKEAGDRTRSQASAADSPINILLPEVNTELNVSHSSSVYTGQKAGFVGRLAAAVQLAGENVFLHYPEPNYDVAGPWLVLEPLGGQIATIHKGRGLLTTAMSYRQQTQDNKAGFENCLASVRDVANPTHPIYPTDRAVFTTGLLTYKADTVADADDTLVAIFEVSKPLGTDNEEIESKFSDMECVKMVSYESEIEPDRATPSDSLRAPVEQAHSDVIGDAVYVWFPEPTRFSMIPTENKIAFGIGQQGASEFSVEQYNQMTELLSVSIQNMRENQ